MLSSLTSYLVQNKKVYIPYIGTFELLYKPAVLHFADRLIYPPSSEVLFVSEGSASREQVNYLGSVLDLDEGSAEEKLRHFGQHLKTRIQEASFDWKGFGKLLLIDDAIVFEPAPSNHLKPVAAYKIIRENAHHDVLVGEKEMHSSDVSYISDGTKSVRSYAALAGWIIVLLALAFIIYHLFRHGFHPFASGLQQKTFSYQESFRRDALSLPSISIFPFL